MKPVAIIGCGATGGWAALQLSALGYPLHLYDGDTVEDHNPDNQIFRMKDVGKLKAAALTEIIRDKTGATNMEQFHCFVESGDNVVAPYIFCLTDTMSSRRKIFESINPIRTEYWVETRASSDSYRIYGIEPNSLSHVERYKKTLYSDDDAERSACGARIPLIAATAQCVAAMAVWQFISHVQGKSEANEILGFFAPFHVQTIKF